jgi:uridylate kinase
MGKNGVEGVYSDDPRVNKNAQLLKDLTFDEVLDRNLKVMDGTAVSLLRDSDIIIRVFSMGEPSNFVKVVEGQNIGTTIHKGE